jgi:hypothetical protein
VLFAAGCLAAPWASLDKAPARQRRLWIAIACVTFPLLPIAVVLGGRIPWLAGSLSGGWSAQAAVYALWEPFLAWGVIIGLLHLYSRRLETPGPVWRSLSRRAYAIYIIHPPVLVALALAWRSVAAPAALKFLVTGTATCFACYLLAGLLLKAPGARRVLQAWSLGYRPYAAVSGQAHSILGVPNRASRAGRNFGFTIRAMNCSAAPSGRARAPACSRSATACPGRSPSAASSGCSAASHAGIGCRRRQRQAQNQDCARERASEPALLFTIGLKKDGHRKDPS